MSPYRDESFEGPCPRCGAMLSGFCLRCGGAFIARERLVDPAFIARLAKLMRPVPQDALRCPMCQRSMRRINVPADDTEVLIDSCDSHGTWFDRGELEQLGVKPSQR